MSRPVDDSKREVGTAPTERVEPSAPAPDATMTAPDRPSSPADRASRPWIGRYRVLKKLGAGGMGAVYAAEDPELDRRVAIKLLHATSETASARLVREARALAKLRHPNVVTIYEVGRDAGDAFVAMELVDGVTLREWLRGERTLSERLEVLVQAGKGLAAAHVEGLVHRDFKPENVMVGRDGRVQVLDFGLAKSAAYSDEVVPSERSSQDPLDNITRTGTVLGTPAYMAPEQFAARETEARTDQFAFCVTLFEALHGFRPFAGATHAELAEAVTAGKIVDRPLADVPEHVQAAIARGLAVDPAARFPDMPSLLAALHARRPPGRRRVVLGAVAALAIAGAAIGIVASRSAGNPDAELFASSGVPAPQPMPLADDPLKVTVHRLSNGLSVWISPNRKSPRIEARLVVRAASRDTPIGGLAHMVEHMLYKGTSRIGTRDFAKESVHLAKLRELYAAHAKATTEAERARLMGEIDAESVVAARYANPAELFEAASALGIRAYRAQTHYDTSVFYADIPSNKFTLWARLEGERMSDPVFRLFHVEAGVVFDEIHQARASSALSAMVDELYAVLFRGHPYERQPGGTFADIVAEPFTAAEEFRATWYVPNNAALLLSGDIDPEQAIPILERELARWRPRALPPRTPRPLRALDANVERTVRGLDTPIALVGWVGVARGHPDEDAIAAACALMQHLADAEAGRARLQIGTWQLIEAGGIHATAAPVAGRTQRDAIAALDEIVQRVQRGDFSDETLAAVLLDHTLEIDRATDTNERRLDRMENAYLGRGWTHEVQQKQRVEALAKADIVRVAKQHFTKRVTVLSEVGPYEMPPVARPKITPIEPRPKVTSPFVAQLLAEETVKIPPRFVTPGLDYRVTDTAGGPLITIASGDDTRYVLRARWDLGSRHLPLLCAATNALEHAGVDAGETATTRRDRWFRRAQAAKLECSGSMVELEVTGLDATFDEGWQDIERWLAGDGITDDVWRAASAEYLDARGWWREGHGTLQALEQLAAFGQTSAMLVQGDSATIKRATTADARAALRTLVSTQRELAYYGPRTADALRVPAVATSPPPPRLARPLQPIEGTRIYTVDTSSNRNVSVAIRISLGPLDDERLAAAHVFAEYLSSPAGGVLWEQIRELRGISYTGGYANVEEPLRRDDPVTLVIYVAANAEQIPETLSITLAAVRDPSIRRTQLERARGRLEESFRAQWIAPRELPERVLRWRAYGIEGDPRPRRFEQTLCTDEQGLAKLAASLASAPTYISLAGDVSAIDRAKLAAIAPVEAVPMTRLFPP